MSNTVYNYVSNVYSERPLISSRPQGTIRMPRHRRQYIRPRIDYCMAHVLSRFLTASYQQGHHPSEVSRNYGAMLLEPKDQADRAYRTSRSDIIQHPVSVEVSSKDRVRGPFPSPAILLAVRQSCQSPWCLWMHLALVLISPGTMGTQMHGRPHLPRHGPRPKEPSA
jgi:hypothetical protein